MKVLLVVLLGIVLTCQGVPFNEESELEDDQKLEDEIEMNEPEIENEQNEAFGDDMTEDDMTEDGGDDEAEDDNAVAESDPKPAVTPKPAAKKPAKKSKKKPFKCPMKYRFCRARTTCHIEKGKAKCKSYRLCVCSVCPKGKVRKCGFKEKLSKGKESYTLECKCGK